MGGSLLLGLFGLLEALAPKRVVNFWFDLATEGDEVTLRPWVYTAARIEGVLIVLWVVARKRKRCTTVSDGSEGP